MNSILKANAVLALYNATHADKHKATFDNEEVAEKLLSSMSYKESVLTDRQVELLKHNAAVMIDLRHVVAVTSILPNMMIVEMVWEQVHIIFVLCDGILFHNSSDTIIARFDDIMQSGKTYEDIWVPAYVQAIKFFDTHKLEEAVKRVVQDSLTAIDAAYERGYDDGE